MDRGRVTVRRVSVGVYIKCVTIENKAPHMSTEYHGVVAGRMSTPPTCPWCL